MTDQELEQALRDCADEFDQFADAIGEVDYIGVQPGSEEDGEPLVLFATFPTSRTRRAFMLRFRRHARNRDELLLPLKDFCRGFEFRGAAWQLLAKGDCFVSGYLAASRLPAAEGRVRVKPGACGQPWSFPDLGRRWSPSNVFGGGVGNAPPHELAYGRKSWLGFPQTTWLEDGSVRLGLHSLSLELTEVASLRERAAIARISGAIDTGSAGGATALECLSAAEILEPDALVEALRSALRGSGYDV